MKNQTVNLIPKIAVVLIDLAIISLVYDFVLLLINISPQLKSLQLDYIILLALLIFVLYVFVMGGSIITMGLLKLHSRIKYISLILPLPFTLTIITIFSYSSVNEPVLAFIGAIVYVVLTIVTLKFIKETSLILLALFFGRNNIDCSGDDFNNISIYSTPTFDENLDNFIKDILINLLGYKFQNIKAITVNNKKYEVYEYVKSVNNGSLQNQIAIITRIKLHIWDNINSIQEKESIEEYELYDNIELICETTNLYDLYQIYQFYDDGESLFHCQSDSEISLALMSLLPKYTNIYVHKDDDVTPRDIRILFSNIFKRYLFKKYSHFVDSSILLYSEITTNIDKSTAKLFKVGTIGISTILGTYFVYKSEFFGNFLDSISATQSPILINGAAIITIAYTLSNVITKLFTYYKHNIFIKNKRK